MILPNERDMEATATDDMVQGLMSHIYRSGHLLTPAQVDRIHLMLTDSEQPNDVEGRSQTEAAKAIKERTERDVDDRTPFAPPFTSNWR